jgi:hypothetical protein
MNASRQRATSVLSNGESDALSNRQVLPSLPVSSALLLSIAQNMGEISWSAPDTVVPNRAPPVSSISHPSLPSSQSLAEEHNTGFTCNNSCHGAQEPGQSCRRRPSSLLKTSCADPLPPPCVEGCLPPLSERTVLPLSIIEQKEWSPEFLSFVRSELVEVFRASGEDVADRINNKRIVWHQVGIRCRFCAHLPRMDRVRRATTFPSSIARLHHSVSMMSREHFLKCPEVPNDIKTTFKTLREKQDASSPENKSSRTYWSETAKHLGLVDGIEGIMFYTEAISLRGQCSLHTATSEGLQPRYQALVEGDDRRLVSDYLYFLMSQAQRISLVDVDLRRNGQHSLPLGMAGFGCRHCCQLGVTVLTGQNRIFPAKLRQLPAKANLLYEHIEQCEQCPDDIKACMSLLKSSAERREKCNADQENEKKFFGRIFVRLHGHVPTGVPVNSCESNGSIDIENYLQNDGDEPDTKMAAR